MEILTFIVLYLFAEWLYSLYRTKEDPIPPEFKIDREYEEYDGELVEDMQGLFPMTAIECLHYKPPLYDINDDDEVDDEDLIEQLNEGDIKLLALLFQRYKKYEAGYTFLLELKVELLITKEVTCYIRSFVGEGKVKLCSSHKAYKRIFDSTTYDLEYHDITLYIHENNQFEIIDKMSYSEDRFLD